MIVKEKQCGAASGDRFTKAGNAAELQMAHYLKRAFGRDPEVLVFNDLQLTDLAADAAQIDHLVIHPYGMVIIESKSISTKILVNRHGEFSRHFDGQYKGIPSPIEQAKRQANFIRQLLIDHKTELRDRAYFGMLQGGFKYCPIDIFIAISDGGMIERKGFDSPALKKADQVTDAIKAIIERHRKASRLFAKDDDRFGNYTLNPAERQRIQKFLMDRHPPLQHKSQPREAASLRQADAAPIRQRTAPRRSASLDSSAARPRITHLCQACQSTELEILHGRYGYYFKCRACHGNTPISLACERDGCGQKAKIRKAGPQFFRECAACGHGEVVHVNPA